MKIWIAVFVVAACMVASADTITFTTPAGSNIGGQPVDAQVTFTTSSDKLTITLTDLLANPTSVVQLISDLSFSLNNATGAGSSLSSSSGQEITVAKDGSFALGSTVGTGWAFTNDGKGNFLLNVLGTAIGPAHLIIGPPGGATYSNANGSIAGNSAHNPFLNGSATFTLDIPGVNVDTNVTNVVFSFGTTAGNDIPGTVPEPSGLLLFGSGLFGLGAFAKRKVLQR